MRRDLPRLLDEIKDIRAEIQQRQRELALLLGRRHVLLSKALGSGMVTFADIAQHCGARAQDIGLEFREEIERRKREGKPRKPRGGARPRPPREPHALDPADDPTRDGRLIGSAEIGRMAGVTRSSVSNWKQRHEDFPKAVPIDSPSPLYLRTDVVTYLVAHGYLPDDAS